MSLSSLRAAKAAGGDHFFRVSQMAAATTPTEMAISSPRIRSSMRPSIVSLC